MAQFINCKATWVDASSGVTDETGQELQIWTDSPSFRPDIPIDYPVAPHPWMRLLPIAAGVSEADFRLETPVTFVTFRVRQYNATGNGNWSNPSGTTFAIVQQTGANVPQAPGSPGFVVTEGGEIAPPPPPPPPVDPPPPPPPTGGGGSASNYVFTSQFSGTQGLNQWSYRDASDNLLTYSTSQGFYTGAQSFQALWNGGIHPGTSVGTVLRWTAPSNGTALVSGSTNLVSSAGSNGVTFTLKHDAATIDGPVSMTTTTPHTISETVVMTAGQVLDFIVTGISGNNYCSTALSPTIQFTTDGSTPADPTLSSLLPATVGINVGGTAALALSISSVAPAAYVVNIASSDPTKVTVPSTVTIPGGQSSTTVLLNGVAAGTSTITASRSGSSNKTSSATVANPASGSWANAPAGGTVLLDHAFDTATAPGLTTPYNGTFIVSDASAPLSPSNVARHRLEAFAKYGGDELTYQFPTPYREGYFGLYWRTNPQFQGRISSNKLFFLRGVPGVNGVWYMTGGPNMGQANFSLVWSHNSGHLNNGHIMGGDQFGSTAFANVGSSVVIPGIWYKLECHIRASTTATSRDGFLRAWLNGVQIMNYDLLNYAAATATASSPGFINQWVWNQTWDGSGDMGTSNTVPWEHYVDHVRVVGKN